MNKQKANRYFKKTCDFLYQKKILPGSRQYVKFIILGTGRTGSNMLLSALKTHPQAVIYGEIFNNTRHDRIGFQNDYQPYIRYQKSVEIRQDHPIAFLDDYIFRIFNKRTKAVGFKFFYWHCHEENWQCIWDHLKFMKDLKVIHIKRKNRLKAFLSLRVAQKNKEWSRKQKINERPKIKITLDFKDCLSIFKDWEEKELFYDNFFQDHPKHEVYYEALCSHYEKEMQDIQNFLGLTPLNLKIGTAKQRSHSISEIISNYFDLKEQFKGTKWHHFFDI